MDRKVVDLRVAAFFIPLQRRDDVERIDPAFARRAHVDKTSAYILRKVLVFVLGVKNKDLAILCGKLREDRLCRIGFARARFAYDDHI